MALGGDCAAPARSAGGIFGTIESSLSISGDVWGHVWPFDLAKAAARDGMNEMTITLDGIGDLPADAVVYLVDMHLGRIIDPRTEAPYTFILGARDFVRSDEDARFAIVVGSEEFAGMQELPSPPDVTALRQNYPNPFNPATVIRYDIAAAGEVSIDVYDVRGSLIRTLYRGYRGPGRYEIGWNGTNDRGRRVESGVYFCRLTTAGSSSMKKLVLLR